MYVSDTRAEYIRRRLDKTRILSEKEELTEALTECIQGDRLYYHEVMDLIAAISRIPPVASRLILWSVILSILPNDSKVYGLDKEMIRGHLESLLAPWEDQ